MRLTLDLPDWIVAALLEMRGPPEIIGETLEDRCHFVLDDFAVHAVESERERQQRAKSRELHERLGLDGSDDDD